MSGIYELLYNPKFTPRRSPGSHIDEMIVEEGWIVSLDRSGLAGKFEQRIDFDPRTISDLQVLQVV